MLSVTVLPSCSTTWTLPSLSSTAPACSKPPDASTTRAEMGTGKTSPLTSERMENESIFTSGTAADISTHKTTLIPVS
eukprot:08449_6